MKSALGSEGIDWSSDCVDGEGVWEQMKEDVRGHIFSGLSPSANNVCEPILPIQEIHQIWQPRSNYSNQRIYSKFSINSLLHLREWVQLDLMRKKDELVKEEYLGYCMYLWDLRVVKGYLEIIRCFAIMCARTFHGPVLLRIVPNLRLRWNVIALSLLIRPFIKGYGEDTELP